MLLLFVNDHYRIYELKSKIKASAYLAASMLQQISNIRNNKQLTKNDIAQITYASSLTLFHTNSMFNPWSLGIIPVIDFYYVKRINSNSYQVQFSYFSTNNKNNPSDGGYWGINSWTKNAYEVSSYHPDLICEKDGEERLCISYFYRKLNFDKKKLGLLFIEPNADYNGSIFIYKLVITPKPGIFPINK